MADRRRTQGIPEGLSVRLSAAARLLSRWWPGFSLLEVSTRLGQAQNPINVLVCGNVPDGEIERVTLVPQPDGFCRRVLVSRWPVREIRSPPEYNERLHDPMGVRLRPVSAGRAIEVMRADLEQVQPGAGSLPREHGAATIRTRALYRKYVALIGDAAAISVERYRWWQERFEASSRARSAPASQTASVMVILPVDRRDQPPELLATLQSLQAQSHAGWTLAVVGPTAVRASVDAWVAETGGQCSVTFFADNESASQALPLWSADQDERFGLFLAPGDCLAPRALERLVGLALEHDADVVYGDEDRLTAEGDRSAPCFKPEWNRHLARSVDYIGDGCLLSARLLCAIEHATCTAGASRRFVLAAERLFGAQRIVHVPEVVVHRFHGEPVCKPPPLGDDLPGRPLAPSRTPRVTIVIPTRDRLDLLEACVDGLLNRTAYRHVELLVVDNGSVESDTLDYLQCMSGRPDFRVIRCPGKFNFAALCNRAAAGIESEWLLLLNNDIVVQEPDWLGEMVALALDDDVGCVGARLTYPDGSIQHAGIVLGMYGIAGHPYQGFPTGHPGFCGWLGARRDVSALTGACLLVKRSIYEQVGGMDERLAQAYNDVDFCLRVREAGYLNVFTPFASLLHHESLSRGFVQGWRGRRRLEREKAYLRSKWGERLNVDPYFSVHLDAGREDFADLRVPGPSELDESLRVQ